MKNCTLEQIEQKKIGLGNTKNQPNQSKYWPFTYHEGDYETFDRELEQVDNINFWLYSQEYGEEGDTPHLQGYVECKDKARWSEFKLNTKIHWEKRKDRATKLDNIVYCCKVEGEKKKPYRIDWKKKWFKKK